MLRIILVSLMIVMAPSAHASESEWATQDYVQARLISAVTGIDGAESVRAGLDIRLAAGWHAYWRMPGDSGLAPELNWGRSENISDVAVSWPAPRRFETLGLYGFGFEDQVLLPLTLHIADPAKPAVLLLDANIMVCADICVPQSVTVSLSIPAEGSGSAMNTARIHNAFSRLPATENNTHIRIDNIIVGPEAVVINAYARRGFSDADVFVESGDYVYITAKPDITVDGKDGKRAMIRIEAPENIDNLTEALSGVTLRITMVAGRDAIEQELIY